MSGIHYNLLMDHPFSINSTPHSRRPSLETGQMKAERSSSFGHTLKSKASKLLRRNEDKGNLTPLTPDMKDWSDEFDDTAYECHLTADPRLMADGMCSVSMPVPTLTTLSRI